MEDATEDARRLWFVHVLVEVKVLLARDRLVGLGRSGRRDDGRRHDASRPGTFNGRRCDRLEWHVIEAGGLLSAAQLRLGQLSIRG